MRVSCIEPRVCQNAENTPEMQSVKIRDDGLKKVICCYCPSHYDFYLANGVKMTCLWNGSRDEGAQCSGVSVAHRA